MFDGCPRGTCLNDYELREEVTLFLESRNKADLCNRFRSERFQLSLAYLVDIFEVINALNLQLQGRNINIVKQYDTVRINMTPFGYSLPNLTYGRVEFNKEIQRASVTWILPLPTSNLSLS